MKKINLFAILFFCALCSISFGCKNKATTSVNSQETPKPSGKILLLSDIHFNPFYDVDIVSKLVKADYKEWEKIFDASGDSSRGVYGIDLYYPLLKSAVKAMGEVNNKPDFIIITGDFISHNFEASFTTYTGITNTDTLHRFIEKTVSFVAWQIEKQYPNTPILPVLGNNDDFCGDYHIEPNGPFLKFFAQRWQPILQKMQGAKNFVNTFSTGGYYAVAMPWDSSQVFIGINSVFFSENYSNVCGSIPATNAGWEQLKWLQETLQTCEAQNQKVWMAYHIPPGINVYSSSHGKTTNCSQNVVPMWETKYNDSFMRLVKRYQKTINAGFAGHTHMDDFRVIEDNGTPVSFIHITPAVSPIFSNNPGFQEISWNAADMTIDNNVTYFYKGIEVAGDNRWLPEYDFNKTYNVKGINTITLNQIWNLMGTDTTVRDKYLKLYPVDNPTQKPSPWKAYWCGISKQTEKEFAACYCNTK
jgi:sphingomyelin phosphodiesterase acid-like 3